MPPLRISRLAQLIAPLILLLSASSAGAFTWREADDANALPVSAQVTTGHGCLTAITGGFDTSQDVDIYMLEVVTPMQLSIALLCTANNGPNIWLFDQNGFGVAASSTCAAGSKLILNTFVSTAGTYCVAVAHDGMEPHAGLEPIWTPGGAGERAPNGTGAAGAVTGWVDTGAVLTDSTYRIDLGGTDFQDQMPAPVADFNGDGRYDACDELALAYYYTADDWRTNLNDDCDANTSDIAVLASLLCTTGSAVTALQTSATIDVYFDAAGTVKQLDGVAPNTWVDLSIVARGVTESILAFSCSLESSQAFVISQDVSTPADFAMYLNDDSGGRFARGVSTDTCLEPVDGTVLLLQCRFFYSGEPNCTFSVGNFSSCDRPSEFPSYTACFDRFHWCPWSYFSQPIDCESVINPADIGGDGVDDTCTCRYFQIVGDSDEIGWNMAFRIPGDFANEWYAYSEHPGLPFGEPASSFVTVFIDWLNTLPRVKAGLYESDDTFYVCAPNNFEIGISPYQTSPVCWIPPSPGCEFNPYLREIPSSPAAVPAGVLLGLGNYPNPFTPGTVIAFDLPAPAQVNLGVYDLGGRLLRSLVSGRPLNSGHHEATWNGRDEAGMLMATGVYIYRLQTGAHTESRRMVLLK